MVLPPLMSDIGVPVATLRQMATGQLLRVVHTTLTIIAEQVEANPPVRGEEAPGTPPGLFVGPTLLGTPGSPEADGPGVDADWDSRLAEHVFPGDILSRPEVRAVPDYCQVLHLAVLIGWLVALTAACPTGI